MGVAAGQTVTRTASPIGSLAAIDGKPDWAALDQIVKEWRPDCLIVGLPLNMDDTESEMSRAARRFGARLGERYGLAVDFADERLSTFEAVGRGGDHATAAQIIAETWLGTRG